MSDSDDHKQKMQERQAKQRARVAELKDPEKGLVLVHTAIVQVGTVLTYVENRMDLRD